MQFRAVTCNTVEDVKNRSYPSLSKNIIKTKCSFVFCSSFLSAISLLASLLLGSLSGLNCHLAIGGPVLIEREIGIGLSG